jgi:hypothetical protein
LEACSALPWGLDLVACGVVIICAASKIEVPDSIAAPSGFDRMQMHIACRNVGPSPFARVEPARVAAALSKRYVKMPSPLLFSTISFHCFWLARKVGDVRIHSRKCLNTTTVPIPYCSLRECSCRLVQFSPFCRNSGPAQASCADSERTSLPVVTVP